MSGPEWTASGLIALLITLLAHFELNLPRRIHLWEDFAGFSVSPFSPRHPLCEQAPVDVESNILLPPHPHYSEDYWWLAGSVALVLQQCPWYKLQITRTVKVQRKDDVACNGKPSEDAEATRILATGSSDGNKTQLPAQLPAHSSEASWILDGGIALLSSTAHKFESLWGSVGVEIVRHVVSRLSLEKESTTNASCVAPRALIINLHSHLILKSGITSLTTVKLRVFHAN
ncbi:hypothetical protein B0H13DRAFT_1901556 [Mycena leptocephala]|nr:hypothetical protein B0H13DRAFT_1901556 [Mycena leptocephala]